MDFSWSVNRFDEAYLYEVNQNRFTSEAATQQFEQYIGKQLRKENQLCIIVGSDSGLLIAYLEALSAEYPLNRYLIIEDEQVLQQIKSKITIQSEHITLISFESWAEGLDAAGFSRFVFTNKVFLLRSLGCQDDHYEPYAELFQQVHSSLVKDRLLVEASTLGSKRFVELQILNTPDHLYQARELEPSLAGRDILILAGGPSLDGLKEWLVEHHKHFVILAVTRVASFLQAIGIRPDFYILVDPNPISFDISRPALLDSAEVPLIASNHANERVVSNWRSRVYMLDDRLPWVTDLNNPNWVQAQPTVTHSAIAAAIQAKARRIFLAGMDLCFDQSMKSHVSGTPEAAAGSKLSAHTFPVKTYSGQMAETDRCMLLSIEFAEQLAEEAKAQSIPIYNLSVMAASVPGIEYLDKAMVTDLVTQSNDRNTLLLSSDLERQKAYQRSLLEELECFYQEMEQLYDALKSRAQLISKLFTHGDRLNDRVWQQVSEIDKLVEGLGESKRRCFMIWGFGYFFEDLDQKNAANITPKELQQYFTGYYKNHLTIADEMKSVLGRARDKCKRRLAELETDDLDQLAVDWSQNGEYFRPEIYTKLNPTQKHKEQLNHIRDELSKQYQILSSQIDEQEKARCLELNNEAAILSKSLTLFRRKSVDQLDLLQKLIKQNEQNQGYSAGLLHLIKGYVCELHHQNTAALDEYELVINSGDRPCLIPALKRILFISNQQQNYAQSLQAIDCISLIDPTYLKIYAEFLLKIGSVHEALDKLADYNQAFPDDIDNLARIAEVYHEVGHAEQALDLIEKLQAKYPEHPAIQKVAAAIKCST